MLTSSWKETRWGRIARGTLSLVLHGTGSVLIATGRAAEYCGECLQGFAARVSGAPRKPRRTARAARVAHA